MSADVGCEDVHGANVTDQCLFVKTTDSCSIDEGFVNYTEFLYCTLASVPIWFACIILIIWWLFMFSGLAVTADDFFCPSLAVISRSLKLSHNVAGVTFLAFGNGAPDVFSAVAAIGNAKAGDAGLAIGALFGAGVFVTAVVAGSISIIKPFHVMQRPLLRDVIFYLTSCYVCWYIMWDKVITQAEAAGLLGLYGLYVIVVIVGRYVNQKLKKRKAQQEHARRDRLFSLRGQIQEDDNDERMLDAGDDEDDDEAGMRATMFRALTVRGRRASVSLSHHSPVSHQSHTSTHINDDDAIFTTHRSRGGGRSKSRSVSTSPRVGINNDETAGGEVMHSTYANGSSPLGGDFLHPNIQVEIEDSDRPKSPTSRFNKDSEAMQLLFLLLEGINPINTEEWSDMAIYWKVYEVFKCPIVLFLKLTIPVVEDVEDDGHASGNKDDQQILVANEDGEKEEEPDLRNWNRPLNSLQIFLGLTFSSIVTGVGMDTLGGVFPLYALVMIISAGLAVAVFLTSKTDERPKYHVAFGYLGFLVAVIWIYCIANEIVNILQALGVVFDLSDAILGLTLLAWGNSIGDLISDITMARQGYPRMAISACFGGPVFNMLIGLGLPFTIACAKDGGTFELKVTLEEMVLAAGLALSLVATLLIVPANKFFMSRPYGIFLLGLYVVFLLVAILTELNVINNFQL